VKTGDFESTAKEFDRPIKYEASKCSIPGMAFDDVYNEILIVVWKAFLTYKDDMGTTFHTYWRTLWNRRKASLLAQATAFKRNLKIISTPVDDIVDIQTTGFVQLPDDFYTPQEQAMWNLIAVGSTRKEVLESQGISKRRYYKTLERWKEDPNILDMLRA